MKIVLDENEYELGELTLNQWSKVKDMNMTKQSMSDPQFISLMTGIPEKEIRQATVPQIGFVSKVLETWFSNTTKQQPLRQLIEFKGQMLGVTSPSEMSWGEWTDLEVLFAQENRDLKHIAAILYRPCESFNVNTLEKKIVKYDYEECKERSKDMGDFPLCDIYSGVFFLMKYAQLLTNKEKHSLEVKMKETMELRHQMKEQNKKS